LGHTAKPCFGAAVPRKLLERGPVRSALTRALAYTGGRCTIARILIIDDEAPIRRILRIHLERAGYQVTEAPDGRAGLELHAADPADLIITDLFMPDFDGIETIRELRRVGRGVKVIVVSGGDSTGRLSMLGDATMLGADRAFSKPAKPEELLKAIREMLDGDPQP
jgi:DNA-binding response OmpR family regulator